MNLQVELTNFYLDEEGEVLPALKSAIIQEAVSKIRVAIKEQVDKEIATAIREAVDKEIAGTIVTLVRNVVDTQKIMSRYGKSEVTISEHIEQMMKGKDGYDEMNRKISQQVSKTAETFVTELKKRYDFQFAASVVEQMAKQNLLKEDAISKLLVAQPSAPPEPF